MIPANDSDWSPHYRAIRKWSLSITSSTSSGVIGSGTPVDHTHFDRKYTFIILVIKPRMRHLFITLLLHVGTSKGWMTKPFFNVERSWNYKSVCNSNTVHESDHTNNPVIFVKSEDTLDSQLWVHPELPPAGAEETWRWCTNFVVPLNLCPWAAASVRSNGCLKVYLVDRAHDVQSAVEDASNELMLAIRSGTVDANVAISFVVTTDYWEFGSFYAWFLDVEDAYLDSSFDEVTLAPFHPDWQFQDDEPALAYEKKSPYPTISIVSRAVVDKAGKEVTSSIAGHNEDILLGRGYENLRELYQRQVFLHPNPPHSPEE